MATPRDIKVSPARLWFSGPTFWYALVLASGIGWMGREQSAGIETVRAGLQAIQKVVAQEVEHRTNIEKILGEIRDHMREDFVSWAALYVVLANLGKLNPELKLPVLTGR